MKFNESSPIYEQIIEYIKKKIVRGEFTPGDKLPSQRDMAEQIRVNANTVLRAYQELERRGLVETKRGRGTFIVNDQESLKKLEEELIHRKIKKFLSEMLALNLEPTVILNELGKKLQELSREKDCDNGDLNLKEVLKYIDKGELK